MVPLTDYLQLPTPCTASTNSGSQQLRLCNLGVRKSDTSVEEAELLAEVGSWLKESTCVTVISSSEHVRAASTRRTCSTDMHFPTLGPHCINPSPLHLRMISALICTSHSRPIALTPVRWVSATM